MKITFEPISDKPAEPCTHRSHSQVIRVFDKCPECGEPLPSIFTKRPDLDDFWIRQGKCPVCCKDLCDYDHSKCNSGSGGNS